MNATLTSYRDALSSTSAMSDRSDLNKAGNGSPGIAGLGGSGCSIEALNDVHAVHIEDSTRAVLRIWHARKLVDARRLVAGLKQLVEHDPALQM